MNVTGVSVIIPTFNAAGFVGRAIRSALSQHDLGELILVDDGSTDDTVKVLEAAARSDGRVRVLRLPENRGPAAARNAGLEAARGEWVAMLDADDAFAPDRLARLCPFAVATGADLVADDLRFYDAKAARLAGTGLHAGQPVPPRDLKLTDFLTHNLADGTGLDWGLLKPVIRRSLLVRTGVLYDAALRHGEDFAFMVDLLQAGARFRILPVPLYLYTQRHGTISGRASGMNRTRIAYDRLRDASLAMADRPGIRDDAHLVALLRKRARGLAKLDHAAFLSVAIRRGALLRIAGRCLRNREFPFLMVQQFAGAVKRRVARLLKIGVKTQETSAPATVARSS